MKEKKFIGSNNKLDRLNKVSEVDEEILEKTKREIEEGKKAIERINSKFRQY
jgi:hypothetical protein